MLNQNSYFWYVYFYLRKEFTPLYFPAAFVAKNVGKPKRDLFPNQGVLVHKPNQSTLKNILQHKET